MAEILGSNKNRKLPPRYPREQEIMVFGEMCELDHVLDLLSDLGEHLSAVPDTITNDEWEGKCVTPLYHLAENLRKAYVEYERFWNPDGWKLEDDHTLTSDLSDFGEMRWRVKDIEAAPFYDPAQLACAQSLYMSLALSQCPGGNDWVEYCIDTLRYELTRYHAAALEVVQYRNAVYLSDAHDEMKAAAPDIKTGRKLRTSAQERAEQQKREADIKAVEILKKYHELHAGRSTKSHAVKLTAEALKISIATVWRAFPRIKKTTSSRAD